jgi:hypothetical protein
MAITYPLSPPSGHRTAQKIKLTAWTTTAVNASPYTGSQQVYQWPGEGWLLEVSLPPMKLADAEAWISFLIALRGRTGTFLFGDTARTTSQGPGTGGAMASGSGNLAGNTSIATTGWTHSVTGILKAGDYFQIQASGSPQRLYKVLVDANSDSSGNATFEIFPRLRETIPNLTSIYTGNIKGTFRLAEDNIDWDIDAAKVYGISFKAVEAI